MKKMVFMKVAVFTTILMIFTSALTSQEALKSTEEEYYDFLALEGLVERPTLNYRTLSDSVWNLSDEAKQSDLNVWKNNNLGSTKQLWKNFSYKIYGPDWFNSYNTAAPYGQNDGALWQGKGYNSSLTGGIRLEGYGLEMTIKPMVCFSQNLDFTYMTPSSPFASSVYDDKASIYGYYRSIIDYPQRLGNSAFWTFDFGDTEIRYTWKTFTAGFGTQAIWLGPAWLNPLLSSNNAASYPKVDIGLRKTSVRIPWLQWYIGDIEARLWTGYLSESDYFDNDPSNDHNMINGFSISYAPSFLPGLTIGANRICLTKWSFDNLKYIVIDTNNTLGSTGEDQKGSVTVDWLSKKGGIEVYSEIGIDDYLQGGFIKGLSRYPFDTLTWTIGLKKVINISSKYNLKGEFIFEWCNCEEPWDRISSKEQYSFNFHYQISQGYTNRGQAIGTALGNGGNGQYLGFKVYHTKGYVTTYLYRYNPDDTYMYAKAVAGNNLNQYYKANLVLGIENLYCITPNFSVKTGMGYDWIINPYYNDNTDITSINNFLMQLSVKYIF